MAKKESCLLILVKMFLMLTLLIAAAVASIFYLRDFLNEYFNRGETIEVPDFRGKHLVDVIKEKPIDLNIEKTDEKFDPRYPKDHVIAQYPEAGTRVKRNKKIMLTISKGSRQVNVPNMIEKSSRESTLSLLNAQLREGNRTYIFSNKVLRDRIITQSPLPFTTHEVNGGVDLLISLGPGPIRAPLPNLVNKPLSEARSSLAAYGLKEGKILSRKDATRAKDRIIMTRPAPFENVSEGQAVSILVSSGNEPGNARPDELKDFENFPVEKPEPAPVLPPPPTTATVAASGSKAVAPVVPPAPPKILIDEEEEEDDSLANQPADEDTPAVESAEPRPAAENEGADQTVAFTMPDGFMPKEVKFILITPEGRREIYSGTHKPLDLIRVKVPKTPGATVQIYINNMPIEERPL